MAPFKNSSCLRFSEDPCYKSALADQLHQQRKQGLFCDLSLHINENLVPAHKCVLVAKSDYFAAMFSQNFCEESATVIDMSHVFATDRVAEIVLDFIYTGEVTLNEDTIDEVLQTANHLLLESLGKHCAQYLLSNLAPQNCVHTWALADAYNIPDLALIAKMMTKSRLQDCIMQDKSALEIPGHFLLKILKEAMPEITNIEYLINFLKRWAKGEYGEDCFEVLEKLLACKPDLSHHLTKLWIDLKREAINNIYNTASNNEYESFNHIGTCLVTEPSSRSSEILLTYKVDSCSKVGDTRIHCYAYLPNAFLWTKLGTINTSLPIFNIRTELVGLTNDYLIFNVKTQIHRLIAMSLINTENEVIPYPERYGEHVGLVTYKPFCFNQKLFCIVEDERRSNPLKRRSRYREADFITARNLFVHDSQSKSWRFCCQIPLERSYGGQQAALDYHIIDSGDVAYIWAMDMYWHESGPGGGPFWMKLSPPGRNHGDKFMYCVTLENCPPVTSQEWGYKQVKLLGLGETIHVYGYSHHCNMCTPMLMYNKESGVWSCQEELIIHYPHVVLPLRGDNISPETVHISHKCNVQSLSTGLLFHLEDICPFINKFWALDLDSTEWKELPAPPANGLKCFLSCRIENTLLMKASLAAHEEYKTSTEGPLLHARLPESTSYFQQVTLIESAEDSEDEELLLKRCLDYQLDDADANEDGDWDLYFDALSDL